MSAKLFLAVNTIKQFIFRTTYRKEIILVLLLKLVGLTLLWGLFFSHPVEERLTTVDIAKRFVN